MDRFGYCEYHKDHGHDTDECYELKAEIQKLIKRGYLKEYVDARARPQPRPKSPPKENKNYQRGRSTSSPQGKNINRRYPSPRLAGHIDTISGDRAGGGESRNAKKNYVWREVYSSPSIPVCIEAISFSNAELLGIEVPHDDPIVIAPVIANYTVERMLVDT
ncbi:hypothetical protein LIER_15976 [Lithospermum erythrorhizon]|uniref:Reverse transcriptase domain-containing protein n=1 Tax=Lithospermum erythrorhizon TaxID=34254 RepID=A0AAV3Q7F1_LITER